MNNEERIKQLERQVQELLSWKTLKERQQLSYPLDEASKNVLTNDFVKIIGDINYTRPSGREVPLYAVGKSRNKDYYFSISPTLFQFTASTSDVITISSNVTIQNDTQFILFSSQTLPTGLLSDTIYYSVSSSGNTCKLSLTSGGAAVDITSTGLGTHYLYFA